MGAIASRVAALLEHVQAEWNVGFSSIPEVCSRRVMLRMVPTGPFDAAACLNDRDIWSAPGGWEDLLLVHRTTVLGFVVSHEGYSYWFDASAPPSGRPAPPWNGPAQATVRFDPLSAEGEARFRRMMGGAGR